MVSQVLADCSVQTTISTDGKVSIALLDEYGDDDDSNEVLHALLKPLENQAPAMALSSAYLGVHEAALCVSLIMQHVSVLRHCVRSRFHEVKGEGVASGSSSPESSVGDTHAESLLLLLVLQRRLLRHSIGKFTQGEASYSDFIAAQIHVLLGGVYDAIEERLTGSVAAHCLREKEFIQRVAAVGGDRRVAAEMSQRMDIQALVLALD